MAGTKTSVPKAVLAESCRMSVVDGSTVDTDGPVILMTFESGSTDAPVVIAVRPEHVSSMRNSLLDQLMTVGVRIEMGGQRSDEDPSTV